MVVPISKILDYIQLKLVIIREYLNEMNCDAVLLHREDNISWLTCEVLSELPGYLQFGKLALLVTINEFYIITSNPEVLRTIDRDMSGLQLKVIQLSIYGSIEEEVTRIMGGQKVSSDTEMGVYQAETSQLDELRFSILR